MDNILSSKIFRCNQPSPFANKAGLDMLETTLVALQTIFDEAGGGRFHLTLPG